MTDQEQPEQPEAEQPEAEQPEAEQPEAEQPEAEQQPGTFTRDYVEGLRREAAGHRTRATETAAERDALAGELWTARVEAAGRLADPTDLPFDPEAGDPSAEAVTAAIDALLEAKPHLARRRVGGSIGQGQGEQPADVSLMGMLRQGA